MTLDIDEGRFQTDARYRAWALARRGAMEARGGAIDKARPEPRPRIARPNPKSAAPRVETNPRPTRRRSVHSPTRRLRRELLKAASALDGTRQALTSIRTMVILRDPPSAVADKIDDLLFKLRGEK